MLLQQLFPFQTFCGNNVFFYVIWFRNCCLGKQLQGLQKVIIDDVVNHIDCERRVFPSARLFSLSRANLDVKLIIERRYNGFV